MVAGSLNSAPELTEMNQEAGMPRMRRTSARRPWRPLQTGQWGSKRTPELLLCGLGARGNVCQSPLVLKKSTAMSLTCTRQTRSPTSWTVEATSCQPLQSVPLILITTVFAFLVPNPTFPTLSPVPITSRCGHVYFQN